MLMCCEVQWIKVISSLKTLGVTSQWLLILSHLNFSHLYTVMVILLKRVKDALATERVKLIKDFVYILPRAPQLWSPDSEG